jgi:hypothetical protein
VRLAGVGKNSSWGKPIYWADAGDKAYSVVPTKYRLPPELSSLRIPAGARPAETSDSDLVIFDLGKGYVVNLWRAAYNAGTDTWSAGEGSVYYLSSNGLDGRLPQSDNLANAGHRGIPGSIMAVRWDEFQSGAIDHVVELFIAIPKEEHVFPMTGHEKPRAQAPYAPPEGTRIRIKPSVDLASRGLSPEALVIARALQDYGAVIGDTSGSNVNLRFENTSLEGLGRLWVGVLAGTSLAAITFDDYEVIELGYGQ